MITETIVKTKSESASPFSQVIPRFSLERAEDSYDKAVALHTAIARLVGLGMANEPCSPRILSAYNELVWESLGLGQAKEYEYALDERVNFGDLRQRTRKLRAILETMRKPTLEENAASEPTEPEREEEEAATPGVAMSFVSTLCAACIVFLISAHFTAVCF